MNADGVEAAAPLFEELDDSQAMIEVHSHLAFYLATNSVGAMDVVRALPHFEKAEALLAEQPESARHAVFYISMAAARVWVNRISGALAAAKRGWKFVSASTWTGIGAPLRMSHLCHSSIWDR